MVDSSRVPPDPATWDPARELGEPGQFPFTRGIQPTMYRGRLWTMRQYAGLRDGGRVESTVSAPARTGGDRAERGVRPADSDRLRLGPSAGCRRSGPRGRCHRLDRRHGGAVRRHPARSRVHVDDHQFDGHHPVGDVRRPCRTAGVVAGRLSGTVQNDILKEYLARGTYIYPPQASLRLVTDIFAFCERDLPRWNTISVSGYHIREAGATAVQEVAFTLANGIAYIEAGRARGLDAESLGERMSFFFAAHNDFLEEIAKFRAARRMWARIMRGRFGVTNPRAQQLRFHAQTAGSTLTAQQPDNNLVRVTVQALAAVLGGAQSLHCNGRDEALALPTEESATLALRTQQIIAYESGVANTVDPVGGSYEIESRTSEIETGRDALLDPHRSGGRHARRDRERHHPARDTGVGVPGATGDRERRVGGRRRQQVSDR